MSRLADAYNAIRTSLGSINGPQGDYNFSLSPDRVLTYVLPPFECNLPRPYLCLADQSGAYETTETLTRINFRLDVTGYLDETREADWEVSTARRIRLLHDDIVRAVLAACTGGGPIFSVQPATLSIFAGDPEFPFSEVTIGFDVVVIAGIGDLMAVS